MSLGLLSINECRGLLGLEPIEGGNKRLQSLNFVDSDKANKYQIGEEEKEENLDDKRLQSLNFVDSDKANKYQIGEEEKEENLDDKGDKNSDFKPNKQ